MNLSKLTDAQLAVVEKIVNEAKSQGLDPNLALTIAEIETGGKFSHTRGDKVLTSPKGALGVMQLMPDTAKGLQVDPYDLDENIRGGVSLLKQHMDQYKDPMKAAVAYNTSEKTRKKFFETDDLSVLPDETIKYLDKFTSSYTPEEVVSSEDVSSEEKLPVLSEITGEAPKTEELDIPLVDPKTGVVVGGGAGFVAGTAETGANIYKKTAERFPILSGKSVSDLIPTQEQHARGIQGTLKDEGITGRASQTTYNERTAQIARQQKAQQAALEKLSKKGIIDPAKALQLTEGISASTPSGVLVSPEVAHKMEQELAKKIKLSELYRKGSQFLGKIPLGSTLTGVGAGLDVAEAANRYQRGDIVGSGISGLSALGQAGMLLPHPVPRIGGALLTAGTMPADYIYKVLEENKKRKKQGLSPISKGPAEIEYDPMGNPIR